MKLFVSAVNSILARCDHLMGASSGDEGVSSPPSPLMLFMRWSSTASRPINIGVTNSVQPMKTMVGSEHKSSVDY